MFVKLGDKSTIVALQRPGSMLTRRLMALGSDSLALPAPIGSDGQAMSSGDFGNTNINSLVVFGTSS